MAINSKAFWDRAAPRYSQQNISDADSYARKLATTQALMQPHMQVLELGCGTGSTALAHAPYVSEIVATDLSSEMLSIGRKKAERAGINNISFQQADASEFDDAGERFDMVLALNLLHLLPARTAVLAKIHQSLKPGGYFISSTACMADRMRFLRPVITVMQWVGKAPWVSFTRAETLRNEIAAAGFEEREYWTHGSANSLFLVTRKA